MRQEDEQGFLSGKFDDWSGEPIPNGWNALDRKLRNARIRKYILSASVPLLLLLGLVSRNQSFFQPLPGERNGGTVSRPAAGMEQKTVQKTNPQNFGNQQSGSAPQALPDKPSGNSIGISNGRYASPVSSIPSAEKLAVPGDHKPFERSISQGAAAGPPALVAGELKGEPVAFSTLAADERREDRGDAAPALFQAGSMLPLALKTALLEPSAPEFSPAVFAGTTVVSKQIPDKGIGLLKSISLQAGYALSSVQLNHARTEGWKYAVNGSQFTQALVASAGIRFEKLVSRQFSAFYGLESGVWLRQMQLKAVPKSPDSYTLVQTGESSYAVSPVLSSRNEQRSSMLVFARSELGFRRAFSRRAGMLAAAQLWAKISSEGWSDTEKAASFSSGKKVFLPGYRVGLWMQTGVLSQAELSFSSSPEALAPSTAGFNINSGLVSLGLRRSF